MSINFETIENSSSPIINGYVINLKERTDRKEMIQNEFKDTHINLKIFEAIRASPGWIGCLKSALSLVQYAKDNNMDYILLIEDDCKILNKSEFNKNFPKILNYLTDNMNSWKTFNGGPTISRKTNVINKFTHDHLQLLDILYYSSATFILINKNSYDTILSYKELIKRKLKNTYKWDMILGKKFNTIICYPFLVWQHNNIKSDIVGMRSDLDLMYSNSLKCMKRLLR